MIGTNLKVIKIKEYMLVSIIISSKERVSLFALINYYYHS